MFFEFGSSFAHKLVCLRGQLLDVIFCSTIEDRRNSIKAEHLCHPAKMRFKNLADIHSARNAERIQQYVKSRAVFEKRHILFGHNLGDNTLVAVASGHFVANRQCPFDCNVDFYHLQHAAGQLITVFQAFNPVLLFFLSFNNLDPEFVLDFFNVVPERGGFDPLDIKVFYLFINNLIISTGTDFLTCGWIDDINLILLMDSVDHLPEYRTFFGFHLLFIVSYLGVQCFFLFVGAGSASGETFRFYYHSLISAGQFK